MVRVDVVQERLVKLREYVEFLQGVRTLTYQQFVADRTIMLATERALQLSIQCILDIANHILAGESNEKPEDYGQAILSLAKVGVIPPAYAGKIVGMAGFRNVLVHQYVDIDHRLVFENLQQHLADFPRFSEYVLNWLKEQGLLEETNDLGGSER